MATQKVFEIPEDKIITDFWVNVIGLIGIYKIDKSPKVLSYLKSSIVNPEKLKYKKTLKGENNLTITLYNLVKRKDIISVSYLTHFTKLLAKIKRKKDLEIDENLIRKKLLLFPSDFKTKMDIKLKPFVKKFLAGELTLEQYLVGLYQFVKRNKSEYADVYLFLKRIANKLPKVKTSEDEDVDGKIIQGVSFEDLLKVLTNRSDYDFLTAYEKLFSCDGRKIRGWLKQWEKQGKPQDYFNKDIILNLFKEEYGEKANDYFVTFVSFVKEKVANCSRNQETIKELFHDLIGKLKQKEEKEEEEKKEKPKSVVEKILEFANLLSPEMAFVDVWSMVEKQFSEKEKEEFLKLYVLSPDRFNKDDIGTIIAVEIIKQRILHETDKKRAIKFIKMINQLDSRVIKMIAVRADLPKVPFVFDNIKDYMEMIEAPVSALFQFNVSEDVIEKISAKQLLKRISDFPTFFVSKVLSHYIRNEKWDEIRYLIPVISYPFFGEIIKGLLENPEKGKRFIDFIISSKRKIPLADERKFYLLMKLLVETEKEIDFHKFMEFIDSFSFKSVLEGWSLYRKQKINRIEEILSKDKISGDEFMELFYNIQEGILDNIMLKEKTLVKKVLESLSKQIYEIWNKQKEEMVFTRDQFSVLEKILFEMRPVMSWFPDIFLFFNHLENYFSYSKDKVSFKEVNEKIIKRSSLYGFLEGKVPLEKVKPIPGREVFYAQEYLFKLSKNFEKNEKIIRHLAKNLLFMNVLKSYERGVDVENVVKIANVMVDYYEELGEPKDFIAKNEFRFTFIDILKNCKDKKTFVEALKLFRMYKLLKMKMTNEEVRVIFGKMMDFDLLETINEVAEVVESDKRLFNLIKKASLIWNMRDTILNPEKSKGLIIKAIDYEKFLKALEFNNIDLQDIKVRKKRNESMKDYLKRYAIEVNKKIDIKIEEPKIEPVELDDKKLAQETFYLAQYLSNPPKHGDLAPKVLKVWNANVEFPEFKEFKEKYSDTVMKPVFHGTGSLPVAFILRYGFAIVDGDLIKAGRMLGNGIYFSNVIDKVSQYVGDYGFTRRWGTKGYILEMEAVLGKENVHYNAAGLGKDNIRSPEWCVYYPRKQLRIYKVYYVELVPRRDIANLFLKYDFPVNFVF